MQPTIDFDNSYGRLPERFFARLNPKPVPQPKLIKLNEELAAHLQLDIGLLKSESGVAALAGNQRFEGSDPLAMAYAGQQFGNWVPQLGDGRALLLGEVVDKDGIRRDIQLKGSGPTPFSRMGDGRAWLGPVLREYIVSEAMQALGVPTTRALAAVATGEQVVREEVLPGAILTRVSRAHIRVGTFQYFAARRDEEGLRQLADYVIDRLYPELKDTEDRYLGLLDAVIVAQAELVAKWMNVGFIHGVMNTDNVSIAGETIDYGPCAFMDEFHPDRVFSSIDQHGRYAYSNQPRICHWNLVQFAQAVLPLLGEDEKLAVEQAQVSINAFPGRYELAYQLGFNAKLGLAKVQEGDTKLGNDLLAMMAENKVDFTLAFHNLGGEKTDAFVELFVDHPAVEDWLGRWEARGAEENSSQADQRQLMRDHNPVFIPRNHRIEQAIRAAIEDDFEPFHRLTRVLQNPFDEQDDAADLMTPPQAKEVVPYTFCGT
ncbi:MAG: protein adenylyltransferase SelO [Rhizobiaceae bacterium]